MITRINWEAPGFGWVERSVGIFWLMRTLMLAVTGEYITTRWIVFGAGIAAALFARQWLAARANKVTVRMCRYVGASSGITYHTMSAVMMRQLCEHCCHEMVEPQEDGSVRMEALSIAHKGREAHYWHVKCWKEAGEPLVGA